MTQDPSEAKMHNPCLPRLVIMGAAMDGDEIKPRCYAAPDDGRSLEELTLNDLRPWPAMDAKMMLARVIEDENKRKRHETP